MCTSSLYERILTKPSKFSFIALKTSLSLIYINIIHISCSCSRFRQTYYLPYNKPTDIQYMVCMSAIVNVDLLCFRSFNHLRYLFQITNILTQCKEEQNYGSYWSTHKLSQNRIEDRYLQCFLIQIDELTAFHARRFYCILN